MQSKRAQRSLLADTTKILFFFTVAAGIEQSFYFIL